MIDKIEITNFKSIQSLDLSLNDINILIGANGVGKSNFISFFKLIKGVTYSANSNFLQEYAAKNGRMSNMLFYGLKEASDIIGRITFSELAQYESYKFSFNIFSDYNDMPEVRNKKFISTENTINLKKISLSKSRHAQEMLNRILISNIKNYHFHDTSSDSPLKKIARINDNEFLRENGENLPAFLYFLQEKHPKTLRRIERVISSIAPFFQSFNLKPDRLNSEFIQLEWKEKGFDRYQNAQNLSDGTLRFIALATLMLQPNPPETIIIDEPELGLHPSAINKLAGLIRKASAKSQIILSTQSINLVNNFEPEDIITVDREHHESIFRRLSSNELVSWLDDYSIGDLWSKSVIGGQP